MDMNQTPATGMGESTLPATDMNATDMTREETKSAAAGVS